MNVTSGNDLLNVIKRYQYSIQQAQSAGTNDKILRYIHKLSKLPIKLKELEKTGIGKTINALRKCSGTVGEEANLLVVKWKLICTKEMKEKESLAKSDVDHDQSDHDSSNDNCEIETESKASTTANNDRSHSKKKSRSNDTSEGKIHLITIKKDDRKRKYSSETKDKHVKKEKYRKFDSEVEPSLTVDKNEMLEIRDNGQPLENNESEQSGNVDQAHESNKSKKKEKDHDKKSHRKDHEKRHHKSGKHSTHRSGNSKEHRRHSKNSSHDKKDDTADKSFHKRSEKTDRKLSDGKDGKKPNSKISYDSSVDSGSASDGFVRESQEHGDDDFGAALMGIPTATSPKKKSPSSKSLTTRRDDTSISPSSFSSPKRIDDIDSLLSSSVKLEPLSQNIDVFDDSYSFNMDVSREMTVKPELKDDSVSPSNNSPREKFSKPKLLSEDDMFSCMTSTKNQRTKVFSGLKTSATNFKVPTLFELCVRVLQDNFNALEYTGGIPYDLLKPILEKVTAEQLYSFEQHNEYLVDDTDELWQFHVNKHFKKAKLQPNESWRKLYFRCVEERQEKLQSLTENISHAMANSTPARKTKLAYLDTHVKPPRNVARIQQKHGTSNPVIIPKKSKDRQPSPTAIESVKERLAKDACSPSAIQIPTKNLLPPKKKAPLMQKTLRLFKGLNKR